MSKSKKSRFNFLESDDEDDDVDDGLSNLKSKFKEKFQKAFSSDNIDHPLFDVSKSEAKRLLITSRGLEEIKDYDLPLYQAVNKWVRSEKLSSSEVKRYLDRWVTEMKIKTGDTKSTYRKPGKVFNTLTKVGSVNRPRALIHMDLADVNRLNPDKRNFRYPFILVAVDGFSNYVALVPVKNKSAEQILNASKNAFAQLGLKKQQQPSESHTLRSGNKTKSPVSELRKCMATTRIQTDRGTEFFNNDFKRFLRKRGYVLFSSRGSGKAYLAESKIGQMKRQLVRIQNILEDSAKKNEKRRKKKINIAITSKRKKINKKSLDDDDDDDEDETDFIDFKEYKDDWSKRLKVLQNKINNKKNTRTGFSPKELFERFGGKDRDNESEMDRLRRETGARNENETAKKFEPLQDTITKMVLLKKGENMQRATAKKLNQTIKNSGRKGADPNLNWRKKSLKEGDKVFLTYSRLSGHPNEIPMNIFEKKSTQTESQWNTKTTYVVNKVLKYAGEKNTPTRYRIMNKATGNMRKTLYYREELLLKKKKEDLI